MKRLHPSSRNGIISLIPKKDRSPHFLAHWRPIILLCNDYKILAKAVASRVQKHLTQLIYEDQSGFIKGRNASDNIRKVIDTVTHADHKKVDAVLLLLDFEKAFDKVEYRSLYSALEYFNFGTMFINWVKLLFTDIQLCTVNNGHSSEYFSPTRGLFQGNPFSSFGFVLVIELLSISIRNNPNIQGIKIGKIISLLSLFADDLSIFSMNTPRSGQEIEKEIGNFEKCTGLKVNYNKSTVYRIGSARKSNAKQYTFAKIPWTNDPVNLLGIWIAENNTDLIKLNVEPTMRKIENIINIWSNRDLSLIGKILIVNTLISLLFIYKLAVLPIMPVKIIEEFEQKIKRYIWNEK